MKKLKPFTAMTRICPGGEPQWSVVGRADTEAAAEALARKAWPRVWTWWGPTEAAEKLIAKDEAGQPVKKGEE